MADIKPVTIKEAVQTIYDRVDDHIRHTQHELEDAWMRIRKLEKQLVKITKQFKILNEQFTSICG